MQGEAGRRRIAVVLKGYPRLSETFIAQELLGLAERGVAFEIWSLRRPTDQMRHPMHRAITAPVTYLPEYLYRQPWRVVRGMAAAARRPRFGRLLRVVWRDLRRDPSANRLRRFGQACILARELGDEIAHLHVHFLHTPASVARYAAILTGRPWSYSAHAKDIWTLPEWETREKLADADWGVTCTAEGCRHLRTLAPDPARVVLLYHGLDLGRFPPPPASRPARNGSDPAHPVRILSVGRAVAKKGYDDLLQALAALPSDLAWQFVHVGGGPLLADIRSIAERCGIEARVTFVGPKAQPEVVAAMREADIFVLSAKEAADGDRDGLPNVLMEAATQELAIVATHFAAIPELIRPGIDGELVPPGDWEALSNAINLLARDPSRRAELGRAAARRVRAEFGSDPGLDRLAAKLAGHEATTDTLAPALVAAAS